MEMLVIGWNVAGAGSWGFVNVARSVLIREFGSSAEFQRSYKHVMVNEDRVYRSAGADQLQISAGCIDDLTEIFDIPSVREAASLLMLRVMRSRHTIYGKFHCPALAEEVLALPAS
jgi:hypothetical protein